MAKDPAFLFYSKDFYEGTRLMLPEERACLIDLMIYQHQNGKIPSDLRRVMMYCSGVDEATLKATLKAKFKQDTEGRWYSDKLMRVINERREYTEKQSQNGKIGQFFKFAKGKLTSKKLKSLKDFVYQKLGKEELIKILSEATLEGSLKRCLSILEDANAIEDEIVIENKDESSNAISFPWDSENFRKAWEVWKTYKSEQFSFRYKGAMTEQAALTQLNKLTQYEDQAIAIIHQSISNGWKGFFELKKTKHGPVTNDQERIDRIREAASLMG